MKNQERILAIRINRDLRSNRIMGINRVEWQLRKAEQNPPSLIIDPGVDGLLRGARFNLKSQDVWFGKELDP